MPSAQGLTISQELTSFLTRTLEFKVSKSFILFFDRQFAKSVDSIDNFALFRRVAVQQIPNIALKGKRSFFQKILVVRNIALFNPAPCRRRNIQPFGNPLLRKSAKFPPLLDEVAAALASWFLDWWHDRDSCT